MTAHNALVFAHVCGAFLLMGGVTVSLLAKAKMRQTRELAAVMVLSPLASSAVRHVALPGSLVALGTGLALVATTGYTITQGWILAAIVLWLVSALFGPLVHAPRSRRIRAAATAAREQGHSTVPDELNDLLRSGRMWSMLDTGILVLIIWLMVAKPS